MSDAPVSEPSAITLPSGASRRWWMALIASVIVISALHYVTSYRSIELHELFQRLYYVPIVAAAVLYGRNGGLLLAGLSTLLFVPHVFMEWHAWPVFQLDQYAEMVVFTVVGAVTGILADRLRYERDRCRRTALELSDACRRLEASVDERLRTDRLVTMGRLASGIAHAVRTPLAGLLGSLEILGSDIPTGHPKHEFLTIASKEIGRVNRVVAEFIDFTHPPFPATRSGDLGVVILSAARLAAPVLDLEGGGIDVEVGGVIPSARFDQDQVERALLNILLEGGGGRRCGRTRIQLEHKEDVARILIDGPALPGRSSAEGLFEPFPASDPGAGVALAAARRLIENQSGTVHAQMEGGRLHFVVELPLAA